VRPDREVLLMQTAYLWSQRSTCSRLHVGAVIHRDGRILVQGYNGSPAGLEHCNHECTCGLITYDAAQGKPHSGRCPAGQPCTRAVHAEANAIAFAARYGVELEGSHMVVTDQPCFNCACLIVNSGLKSVLYAREYRLADGVNLLSEAGIEVRQFIAPDMIPVIGLPS
jgi:dCMP deaminase